ncbi:hypothetical protein F4781DRAFT_99615 [Annulohypoxylon bovei var. microspora]|nr:hypothetical protein F4781DRAFT_99615 [Annulohypoxylon bovei var. microspora]
MMRELWGCSSCVGLVVLAILTPATIATSYDEIYEVHIWEKNHNVFRHPKREASCQESNYYLCSASVNGGCCPEGYACAVSSCYATTAGPTSACGTEGYYNCPLTAGAGNCCPVGYICNRSGCLPPAGVSSESCAASYFACTSSPYGCCPNGMVCGSYSCYASNPATFAVSDTVTTTNSKGDTITTVVTSTTVITPGPDSSATSATIAAVPKLVASTVSKLPSIETDTSSSSSSGGGGGLTPSQIGGIIGGAVALLVVIVAIAAVVIWQLKRTERATKAASGSRHESSSGQPRSQKSGFGQPSISEVDGQDSIARARNAHLRSLSDDSTVGERSPSQTPNLYGSNTSSTPPAWQGYFTRLPPSDSSDGRQSSLDSYARHDNGTYPQRVSVESQGTHTHRRQTSNASELDGSANSVSELDANEANDPARQRSSSITRTPVSHVRRTSDPSGSSRGARGENSTAIGNPLGTLSEVNELHGYYGSPDLAVGQTAAKLYQQNASVNSLPRQSAPGGS